MVERISGGVRHRFLATLRVKVSFAPRVRRLRRGARPVSFGQVGRRTGGAESNAPYTWRMKCAVAVMRVSSGRAERRSTVTSNQAGIERSGNAIVRVR